MNKKKQYIAPSIRAINLQTSKMLALSTGEDPDERGPQGSREFWYEDEDEDTEDVRRWNL